VCKKVPHQQNIYHRSTSTFHNGDLYFYMRLIVAISLFINICRVDTSGQNFSGDVSIVHAITLLSLKVLQRCVDVVLMDMA